LLAELIYSKPAKPKQYLAMQLEKIKVAGTKPLLNKQDLNTMFGMFDVTAKGCVTEQQAANALRTVLGSRAPEASAGTEASSLPLGQEAFVKYMTSALCSAMPLCKGAED
jgi:Ca2+-binding EF-hand superfamily protein